MAKQIFSIKEATMNSFPLPVTLVTTVDRQGKPNIITITYITGVNEEPPMIGIAVRPQKYSYRLLQQSQEFVVNIPDQKILAEIDYCGSFSGRKVNKFAQVRLTLQKANKVKAPLIRECPINLECKVVRTVHLPSHSLFIGRVIAMHVDKSVVRKKKIDFTKISFLLTTYTDYRLIGKKVGVAFQAHKRKYSNNVL